MDQLSFQINDGEIMGLIGQNGASKTDIPIDFLDFLTELNKEVKYFVDMAIKSTEKGIQFDWLFARRNGDFTLK